MTVQFDLPLFSFLLLSSLLESTSPENYRQYLVIAYNAKEYEKESISHVQLNQCVVNQQRTQHCKPTIL